MPKCRPRLKSPSDLRVPLEAGAATTALVYASAGNAPAALVLAHGAGAGQRSAFMVDFARALCDGGVDVVTFKLPRKDPAVQADAYAAIQRTIVAWVRAPAP